MKRTSLFKVAVLALPLMFTSCIFHKKHVDQPVQLTSEQQAKMNFIQQVRENAQTAKFMRKPSAKHVKQWAIQFEVFNVVGWRNVNSYFWVADAYGQQWASPNYLTGRRYNLKITVDLR